MVETLMTIAVDKAVDDLIEAEEEKNDEDSLEDRLYYYADRDLEFLARDACTGSGETRRSKHCMEHLVTKTR